MPRKNKRIDYSPENLKQLTERCRSITGLMKALGTSPSGKQWEKLKRELTVHNISTAHFKVGGGHHGPRKSVDKMLTRSAVRNYLLTNRGHTCEQCGLTEWQNQQIPLEVDHIDGFSKNNDETNLRLLCPNCHALTPTWRGRKRIPPPV